MQLLEQLLVRMHDTDIFLYVAGIWMNNLLNLFPVDFGIFSLFNLL